MNILISGGTGFLGSRLAELARAAGHHPVILTRHPDTRPRQPGIDFAGWDGSSVGSIVPLMENADAVVNLAGENLGGGRWTPARKRRIMESRSRATGALVEAMAASGRRPRVLISASAMGIYGNTGAERITETHPPGHGFLAEVCTAWEDAALHARPLGVRVVLPRLGLILGPRGGALRKMVVPFRLFLGGHLGPGTQWISWVHRDDAAEAFLFCMN
ncbi:MAG TPA: TIGR01777 family oxidoreductase, partial [Bacteroidota bacterium]